MKLCVVAFASPPKAVEISNVVNTASELITFLQQNLHIPEDEHFVLKSQTGKIIAIDEAISKYVTEGEIIYIEHQVVTSYFPDENFSTSKVNSQLRQSILHQFSREEQVNRIQLAACYRIFEMFGWTDTIYGHLTCRTMKHNEKFLINPFGLLYDEITASSLVRVDLQGNIDHHGIVPQFGINRAGYVIHSAIHEARKDIQCVMHCHFREGSAVTCLEKGLQYISQTSQILGAVTYHEYEGIAVSEEEKKRLQKDLGSSSKVLLLKNHGVVTLGSSIGEAFLLMYTLLEACKMQISAQSTKEPLNVVEESIQRKTQQIAASFNKEGFGLRELSAYMRRLDRIDPSYKL